MSPRYSKSESTVKTVDDVMSQLDLNTDEDTSLIDARKYITKLTGFNSSLAAESISEIESLDSILCPITPNTQSLKTLMLKYGAVLGGPQATSFFYPICKFTNCPWDLYCHRDVGDAFISGYIQSSGAERIEDLTADDGIRVVYLRRTVNGESQPVTIRIFVSYKHPLECILSLRHSYEQSAIMAVGAVCFWPKLQQRKMYRVFEDNDGQKAYPRPRAQYVIKLSSMNQTHLRKPMESVSIYEGITNRIETIRFKNDNDKNKLEFQSQLNDFRNIVYAVFNQSTRYLGTTGNMK